MNLVFKNVFNKSTGEYVVTSEHAKGHSKNQKALTTGLICLGLLSVNINSYAVILKNDVVEIGISPIGTFGSDSLRGVGLRYDETAQGNFNAQKDYLTQTGNQASQPWHIFAVSTAQTGIHFNINYGTVHFETESSPALEIIDTEKGQQTTTWLGSLTHEDQKYYSIQNQYSIDNGLHGVAVETTIFAHKDLNNVQFLTAIDPDSDGTPIVGTPSSDRFITENIRGDSTHPDFNENNWIYAVGPQTGNYIGIHSTSNYQHNTSSYNPWSLVPSDYLVGHINQNGTGDYNIGMGFQIGDLMSGESAILNYQYLMGTPNTSPIPPISAEATWSNIDKKADFYQGTHINSGLVGRLDQLNVRPIFEGGTLKMDQIATDLPHFFQSDFSLNDLGGTLDAQGKTTRFIGSFSNTEGTTHAGDFHILDHSNQKGQIIFEGKNSYNGQTIIENATLALAKNGDLSQSTGIHLNHQDAVFDVAQVNENKTTIQDLSSDAGLVFTGNSILNAGTARDTIFHGQFSGAGGYNKIGSGTQYLSANSQSQQFQGNSNVMEGTLRVDGLFNNDTLNIWDQATLSGQGTLGGLITGETGSFIDPNGRELGTLTFSNDYIAQENSHLLIQSILGDDTSLTDLLVIQGNTFGHGVVHVENLGGQGAYNKEGIKIIEVNGESSAQFSLANGPIKLNAYEYHLLQNSPSTPDDGHWYLYSSYRAGIGNYISTLSSNIETGLNTIASLYQRIGSPYEPNAQHKTTWGRLIGNSVKKNGEKQFDYDQYSMGYQLGGEYLAIEKENSKHRFGLMNHFIHTNAKTYDNQRLSLGLGHQNSSIDTDSFGFGAYYTSTYKDRTYIDLVTQINYVENAIEVDQEPDFTWEAWQSASSFEIGRTFKLTELTYIEPQFQATYIYTHYRDAQDQYSQIIADPTQSIITRIGAQLNHERCYQERAILFYGSLNYQHEFSQDHQLRLNSLTDPSYVHLTESYEPSRLQAGLGLQIQLKNLHYVYADARHSTDTHGDSQMTQVNIGLKGRF